MRSVLFQAFRGVNTVSPAEGLRYDPRSGACELSVATNVDVVDVRQRLVNRPGFSLALSLPDPKSPFVDGDTFYLASGTTIFSVRNMTATPLVEGLTAGKRLAWCRLGDPIYWSNGVEKGRIVAGEAKAWGGIAFSTDAREAAEYANPPAGTVLAAFAGRIWIGVGREIVYTEPGFPHHVRVGACRLPAFPSPVRMIEPVDDGFYVSTEDRIVFLSGTAPGALQQTVVSREPVRPGMVLPVLASDVDGKYNPVRALLWATARGLELGLPGGMLFKLTEQDINLNEMAAGGAMLLLPRRVVALYQR